jgi:hypothetical protein
MAEDNVLGLDAPPPRQGTPLMAVSYKIGNETTVSPYAHYEEF